MSLVLLVLLVVVLLSLFVCLAAIALDWLEHEAIISLTGFNLLLGDLVKFAREELTRPRGGQPAAAEPCAALLNQAAVQLAHVRDSLQRLRGARVSSLCGAVSLCERGAPDGALSEP